MIKYIYSKVNLMKFITIHPTLLEKQEKTLKQVLPFLVIITEVVII
jgi:hypothetical protein